MKTKLFLRSFVAWRRVNSLFTLLRFLELMCLSAAVPCAHAATITYFGADLTSHGDWRNPSVVKSIDVDGDNIYGSDGYLLVTSPSGPLTSLPSYVSSIHNLGFQYASGNLPAFPSAPLYTSVDNPVAVGSVFTGTWYQQSANGMEDDIVQITLAAPAHFRLGILVDNHDFVDISPSDLRVRQTVGGAADSGLQTANLQPNLDSDWYFFDISGVANDQFVVSGINWYNNSNNFSDGIGGLSFDTGCGVPGTDSDLDGTPDCLDGCPSDPNKTAPGACGCGAPESSCLNCCPASSVTGQWDFDSGTLAHTIGHDLDYFGGSLGLTATETTFGTTASFGISPIGGVVASVMRVPGDLTRDIGYVMTHGIAPNGIGGNGLLVNQYTLIMDIYVEATGPGAASLLQIDSPNNTNDGDLFWQNNQFGQGGQGYLGTGAFTAGDWHRVVAAYDEAAIPPVVTKYVDGIFQDDWHANQGMNNPRRALQPTAILFGDGDQDERCVMYVNSIQIRDCVLSKAEMAALGLPQASGIPAVIPGCANLPPVALCQNVTVSAGANCSANASIDNGSYDPDGPAPTLSQSPAGPYSIGTISVTLTATDNQGASSSCTATVTVQDATPPAPNCSVSTPRSRPLDSFISYLWPPQGQMVDVELKVTFTSTDCSAVTTEVRVYSNEPNGSGRHSPDVTYDSITGTLKLRAQRDPNDPNGRVFFVLIKATDAAGNSDYCNSTVGVPRISNHIQRLHSHNVGVILGNYFQSTDPQTWDWSTPTPFTRLFTFQTGLSAVTVPITFYQILP